MAIALKGCCLCAGDCDHAPLRLLLLGPSPVAIHRHAGRAEHTRMRRNIMCRQTIRETKRLGTNHPMILFACYSVGPFFHVIVLTCLWSASGCAVSSALGVCLGVAARKASSVQNNSTENARHAYDTPVRQSIIRKIPTHRESAIIGSVNSQVEEQSQKQIMKVDSRPRSHRCANASRMDAQDCSFF